MIAAKPWCPPSLMMATALAGTRLPLDEDAMGPAGMGEDAVGLLRVAACPPNHGKLLAQLRPVLDSGDLTRPLDRRPDVAPRRWRLSKEAIRSLDKTNDVSRPGHRGVQGWRTTCRIA